jgi:hypothetical protein|tara:strand:+ start:1307 stop:1549 length:243 start_codon:yes stop_codon:yes gene_type:complete
MPSVSVLASREKASQSAVILENPVFKAMIEGLDKDLVTKWKIADTVEERELCWMKLNALRSIEEDLQAFIHNDKIENNER